MRFRRQPSPHYTTNAPPIQYILNIFTSLRVLQFRLTIKMLLTLPSLPIRLAISPSSSMSPFPILLLLSLFLFFLLLLIFIPLQSLVCVSQLVLGVDPGLVSAQPSRGHTWLSLSQQLSNASSSPGAGGMTCQALPALCWDFIWVELAQVLFLLPQLPWVCKIICPIVPRTTESLR